MNFLTLSSLAEAQQVQLPGGYRLDWAGEFGELQEALQRLAADTARFSAVQRDERRRH